MAARLLLFALIVPRADAFLPSPLPGRRLKPLQESTKNNVETTTVLSLSLPKPLGLILEEVEEGAASGVFVKQVTEEGSAVTFSDQIIGSKLLTVCGVTVSRSSFEDVMEQLVNAPATVELELLARAGNNDAEKEALSQSLAVGTTVTIKVLQDGVADVLDIQARVGDNLRAVLLESNVEIYQGLKQKLGNCGGGGQCTFCAFDFVSCDGWDERSDYENNKLKKNPEARLTCLNNIQGPATIRKANR
jgi:ferredoxin